MVPLFQLDRVVVEHDGTRFLDIDHLQLDDGGVTVLLGPSGAGKSTLLRLLDRLDVPTSGTVRFRGTPLDDLDPLVLRRRVAMVFQRPPLFPGSLLDNLHVAEPSLSEDAAARLLRRVGLDPALLGRAASDLSGGEAQRAVLARALATEPEVILGDEPTAALDGSARRAVEDLACQLADEGIPLVWVTHDTDQLHRIASRLVVLIDGRVAATGGVDELHEHPDAAVRRVVRSQP